MAYNTPSDLTAAIGARLFAEHGGQLPSLRICLGDTPVMRLSPHDARQVLYAPDRDEQLSTVVWRQVVSMAQREAAAGRVDSVAVHGGDGREDRWRLLTVWLALPGLFRTMREVMRRFPVDRADVEAEAVLGLLAAIVTADPQRPSVGGQVIKSAATGVWNYARQVSGEIPVVDIAGYAARRNDCTLPGRELAADHGWELHISPPDRPEGLAASLRFTESRSVREGVRLGALAEHLGLREVVCRARRPGEGERIGTLALRRAGARR